MLDLTEKEEDILDRFFTYWWGDEYFGVDTSAMMPYEYQIHNWLREEEVEL